MLRSRRGIPVGHRDVEVYEAALQTSLLAGRNERDRGAAAGGARQPSDATALVGRART